ncbi:MAG TPA: FAD-dependent oxidoreductase, partial [Pirellulales bacterium]|nr:FAD-dependent oxidoreductase [Pirellulales bacterium]
MPPKHFDVIVIGTGPGGEGAAMQAAKSGKSVAVIERASRIGGSCTHSATIPSKALRYAIFQMTEANNNKLFREAGVS